MVTGIGGFIGFHFAKRLLSDGSFDVVGIDSLNDYYDPQIKFDRLKSLGLDREKVRAAWARPVESADGRLQFLRGNLAEEETIARATHSSTPEVFVHLAAQAGVRYSLTNPEAYVRSNLVGFHHVLEYCRHHDVGHLVYASSSSVYGLNRSYPFSTRDNVDHPVSLYAATKKSNELTAHAYSYLFGIPTTGLRFFTVYGPWGRPDMALFLFTRAILAGEPIKVFNNGHMERDFTYVDDVVEGLFRLLDHAPTGDPSWNPENPAPDRSIAPYRVYNIGNNAPVKLMDFISELEKQLGREAEKEFLPMQPGDVAATYADVTDLRQDLGYKPQISVQDGIARFIRWYREYYNVRTSEA